ncbi:hypothetical protein YC2023_064920 [Brassica napus]
MNFFILAEIDKRVRFSYDIRDDNSTGGYRDSAMETSSPEERVVQLLHPYGVPDYVRNPSKYIRYKFDEGEVDEESNRKAYMELLNMIRSRDEPLVELPKRLLYQRGNLQIEDKETNNIKIKMSLRRTTTGLHETHSSDGSMKT